MGAAGDPRRPAPGSERTAIRHTGPTGQVERLAADIERSYLSGLGPESGGAGY
jgi:hypothetical protein